MRKLFLLFTAALLFTSCELLQKKKDKEEDTTEEKKNKKKNKDDDNTDDNKKKKDSKIDDEDYKPQKKDANNDNTNSDTKTTDTRTTNYNNTSSSMRTFNWSSYKMQFKVPSDFTVDENNAEKFNAGNGKIYLSIYPKTGQRLRESDLKSLLTSWARSQNVKYSGDANKMSNLNGYWGVYIDGTASNDLPTSLLLLVDPDDPSISFYVWLQYQSKYLDTAVDILKSFKPI